MKMLPLKLVPLASAFLLFSGCAETESVSNNVTKTSAINTQQSNMQQNVSITLKSSLDGSVSSEPGFSPETELAKMRTQKFMNRFRTGWTSDSGLWIISRHQVKMRNGMTVTEASAIAEIRAKKAIAGFLGSNVSAQEKVFMESGNKNGVEYLVQFSRSVQNINIDQFLRGVVLLDQKTDGNRLQAAYYVTGKLQDTSAELEKQLHAAPPGTVRAIGYSLVENSQIGRARQKALQTALRNAVEQVMGTMVIGQSQLMDNEKAKSKVISQTVGAIKRYRIVREGVVGINYQVIINAKVEKEHIIDNYAALIRSMGNPPFYVETVDPDLKTAFEGFLADLGFLVTPHKNDAAFIFDANCQYLGVNDDYYGQGIQIDLKLRLLDIRGGGQLFSVRNTPRLTSTYSGTFHQIRQSAASKAFKTMKKQLHEKLNKAVMDWVLNGHPVKVVFNNCPADRQFIKTLEQTVAWIPCATLQTKRKDGSRIEFSCTYVGSTADFEDFLQSALEKTLAEGAVPKTIRVETSLLELTF